MKNWLNEVLSTAGIILGVDISLTKDILGIVLVILNILVLIISLCLKLLAWWKKAKEDGKITDDEIQEGINIINDSLKDIKDKEEKHPHKGENDNDIQ